MGVNWLEPRTRSFNQTADIEVRYSNGKVKQYAFNISKGAYATKFKNAERIMVGANDDLTRIYFSPVNEHIGYKAVIDGKSKVRLYITAKKVEETFPTLHPSAVIGTYNLKYDDAEKLYYISIGALPR